MNVNQWDIPTRCFAKFSRAALLQRLSKHLADEQERWMIPTPAVDREFQLFACGNHDDLVLACEVYFSRARHPERCGSPAFADAHVWRVKAPVKTLKTLAPNRWRKAPKPIASTLSASAWAAQMHARHLPPFRNCCQCHRGTKANSSRLERFSRIPD